MKSPDDCTIVYKKTLLKIVQDCNATFVLSHKKFLEELLGSQKNPTSKYLTASLKSTSAEWLYYGYSAVGNEGTEASTSKKVSPVRPLETVKEEEPNSEEGKEDTEVLDKALPQDVAFLQYINSGEVLV